MKNYLFKAIRELRPESEFTFKEQDYLTIEWIVLEGSAPTQKQIDDKIEEIKIREIQEAEVKAAAKAELLNRLGITEDEAKLLLA